jgi:hypothetical protein
MEKNKGLQLVDKKEMAGGGGFSLAPSNLGEAMEFAKMMANTDMVPRDYAGKPANIMIAVQMGAEIGLKPMQSLQNISVINGRPSVWGDTAIALVRVHPDCESINEYLLDKNGNKTTGTDYDTAVCVVKRAGQDEEIRTFSLADAKKARLIGKTGPWSTHEKRMLQLRARGFALRDVFPDALKGLAIAEEAQDLPPRDITPAREEVLTPEFDVPVIDTGRSVMVEEVANEEVVDAATGEITEGSEQKSESAKIEDDDALDATVTGMIDRIENIGNKFEGDNWLTKHSSEINKLPEDAKEVVMNNYKGKMEDLASEGVAKEEGSKGDEDSLVLDYIKKLEKPKSLEELDAIFDEAQNKIKTGAKVVALRKVRDKKAQDFK